MSYNLINIQEYVLKLAELIAEVLRVDVEIVDKHLNRIVGTGRYKLGKTVVNNRESFIQKKAIETGKKLIVENPGFNKLCTECPKKNCCIEKFECTTPIIVEREVIGVISLICFTENQKKVILDKFKEYTDFLDHISELIAAKVKEHIKDSKAICHEERGKGVVYFSNIIGNSEVMKDVIEKGKKIARGNANVLVVGESGTGKELLSRAIHFESARGTGPFIAINCGAIPEALLESELFGYSSGAFTGANKNGKIGKFQLADKGTIFLDEIGDMPLQLQVKLLRVLQDKIVIPIGSNKPIPVDIRIISATNKNLEAMVRGGRFREDLYYRLNVIPIELPPLKKRKEDIPVLIYFLMNRYCSIYHESKPEISTEAMERLIKYPWGGNIRELENTIEYIVNMLQGEPVVKTEHLPDKLLLNNENVNIKNEFNLDNVERKTILKVLALYGDGTDNKKRASEVLGISLATLYRKLEKYGLKSRV
jgi:transcriptional regulator with PAS, ATPase and Fis domain